MKIAPTHFLPSGANHPRGLLAIALASLATLQPLLAHADGEADDRWFVRFGGQRAVFHDDNKGFQGPGIPANAGLQTQTEDLSTAFLSVARRLDEHWEAEILMGVPPTFHVHARGPATLGTVPYQGQPVLSGKQAAPALVLNYKFNQPGDFYRPYLGAGLVYSHFYDLQGTPQNNAINGGATKTTFSETLGIVVVAGVSFKVVDHWRASFSISHAEVGPRVTNTTAGVVHYNYYNLNPIIYTASVGYGF